MTPDHFHNTLTTEMVSLRSNSSTY